VSAYDRALLGIAAQDAVFAKAVDASGNVPFADQNNNRIREVLSGGMGPQTTSPSMQSPSGSSGTATTGTSAELLPVVTEALPRWAAAGLGSAQVDLSTTVPNEVGLALPGVVQPDATAAGLEWFVDSTPASDSDFSGRQPPPVGMDLLTVVMHELGLPDLDAAEHPGDVMVEGLPPGVRLARVSPSDQALLGIASQDAVFAEWEKWTF
jgi:hypothetical protein